MARCIQAAEELYNKITDAEQKAELREIMESVKLLLKEKNPSFLEEQ
jgi:hypothetical protein